MTDRYEKLDPADRWFFDILRTSDPAGFFVMEDVDMAATQEIIARLRQQGIKGTYTHIFVRAAALALARHPELNRLILGKYMVYPGSVDIGIPVGSDIEMAGNPVMVLQNADQKSLVQIAQDIINRAPQVRKEHYEHQERMRRAARAIPISWMRRCLLRMMKSRMSTVREKTGTFYVASVPHLRYGLPLIYPSGAALAITRVEDRVVVRDGQPAVRPTVTLGFVGDHRIWNGKIAAILLHEIKKILEDGELAAELPCSEAKVSL
jgi:pyruvate/2-oxoglutarate dehydrogenase complex dihydrolipoamide acyltransferase (E2) component